MGAERDLDDSTAYLAAPEVGARDAWTNATADKRGTTELLSVEEIEPPPPVASALELALGTSAVMRRQLLLLADKPVEIVELFYPSRIAAGTPLAERRKIKGGVLRALADLGFAAAFADEEIELDARPTTEECELMQIDAERRVVRLFRTSYSSAGTPFEVTSSVMLPEGRKIRHRLTVA